MPSGLQAKLRRMNAASPAPTPPPRGGLLVYRHRHDLEEGLTALDGAALRRIGWTRGAFDVNRCLFLDTETTGLSHGAGTVAFLIGVGYVEDGAFIVEQYLMRDYADEPEQLDRLARLMERFDCVCTFNGSTFDMPLLEARFTMNRMRQRWREMDDLDLLKPTRRTWKLRLGSCRLSRVEELVLGIRRIDDLPGGEVPQRYFAFLKSGDMALLDDIVRHNEQDIVTLQTLLVRLASLYAAPTLVKNKLDAFSIGSALERQGEWANARAVYRVSAVPAPAGTLDALRQGRVAGMSNWRIYHIERRSGNERAMLETLETMLARDQMRLEVLIELAKYYEHRAKRFDRALDYALMARAENADESRMDDLNRRVERLEKKLNTVKEEP